MRKIIVLSFITLDGVMQAPGGPGEDPSAVGFLYVNIFSTTVSTTVFTTVSATVFFFIYGT